MQLSVVPTKQWTAILSCVDLADFRRLVIVGVLSDDVLFRQLVLKGGNAISLVYRYGTRGSLDIDFSIEGDFDDIDDASERIFRGLKNRFDTAGHVLFDEEFLRRPSVVNDKRPNWGGYQVHFKLIPKKQYDALKGDLEAIRRNATILGPAQRRKFKIDISKYEFCAGKTEADLDDFAIYVYTPAMIAIEKVRAICQQMPEYAMNASKEARARDFYDIHVLVTEAGVELGAANNVEIARQVFAAKEVSVMLIAKIEEFREFHRQDWPSVQATVAGSLKDFDFYFDFVVNEVKKLEPLWKI